jgi:flagellum-specific peptidoglycan hydrolase FlgJ
LNDSDDLSKLDDKSDLVRSILLVSREYFKSIPTPKQINVILSHIAHETANGKHIYNYNVGNIKKTKSESDLHDYVTLQTFEYEKGKRKDQPAKFRAYHSLDDGVKDYLNLIHSNPGAWGAVEKGDPRAFSQALKQRGYYTAPEKDYTNSMVKIYNKKPDNKEPKDIKQLPSKPHDMITKIYDMLSSMEKSINAYDISKSITKKGKYGN